MMMPEGTRQYLAMFGDGKPAGQCAYYTLGGDLNQMGIMEERLRDAGFNVVRSQSGTYPGFLESEKDEYVRALKYLFVYRVAGWWNQREAMIENKVCAPAEFKDALDAQIASKR